MRRCRQKPREPATQTWTGTVSDETSIWLDRTEERQSNLYGTVADCRPGRLLEIKYAGKARASGGRIEWVKVQVTDSRTRAEAPPALAAATGWPWFGGWLIPFP